MSRPLKFRIWDNKRKEWVHGDTSDKSRRLSTDAISLFGEVIIFGEILCRQSDDSRIPVTDLGDLEAVQFTGLKDKHGRDIYEGDIIKCTGKPTEGTYVGVVTYGLDVVTAGFSIGSIGWYKDEIEIIGNKFENPELMP